jgi:hypothetical protein
MAKAKAKAKTTPKKAVVKKVEEPKVEEKVIEEPVIEKPVVQETKIEEVTHTISHRNVDVLVELVKDFISENVKPGHLISSTRVYDPDSEKRVATIVYKK